MYVQCCYEFIAISISGLYISRAVFCILTGFAIRFCCPIVCAVLFDWTGKLELELELERELELELELKLENRMPNTRQVII